MKVLSILICLAIATQHQTRADSLSSATASAKEVLAGKTNVASNIASAAGTVASAIGENINTVRNYDLRRALQQTQQTLEQIQANAQGALQESETAATNVEAGVKEIEKSKTDTIQPWVEKANKKIANASGSNKRKGQELINNLSDKTTKSIDKATARITDNLEDLQSKVSSSAERYQSQMSELVSQIGKCAELKESDTRELRKCASSVRRDLVPLLSAPTKFDVLRRNIIKAGSEDFSKNLAVQSALRRFSIEGKAVDRIVDRLAPAASATTTTAAPSTTASSGSSSSSSAGVTSSAAAETTTTAAPSTTASSGSSSPSSAGVTSSAADESTTTAAPSSPSSSGSSSSPSAGDASSSTAETTSTAAQ